MNQQQVEKDIRHLESIVSRLGCRHGLSITYWRDRIDVVLAMQLVPTQRERAMRLRAVLPKLEADVFRS